jgi:hypothetical protein
MRPTFFHHIPKTGGTAIEQLFHQLDDMQWGPASLYGHHHSNGRWFELQHLTAVELRQRSSDVYQDYEHFAIVRDPYQRLISDYLWRSVIAASYPDAPIQAFDTFDAFIATLPADLDHQWQTHIKGVDKASANLLIHTRPQRHFLVDTDLVADPSITVLRLEDLPGSIEPLLNQRGITSHDLRTPTSRPVDAYFTPDSIRVVNNIYARDFEMLPYPLIDGSAL